MEVPKAVLSIMKIPCRSSIKDIRTNLRVYWDLHPLPLSRPVHIWLTTPSPISMLTQGWHYLKHCNLRTIHTEGYKELIILILDVHTCVFLLDNFDNSIPKDGVDHEGNVTHRHDWPNKNASVPKSLSGKRKDFIFQSLWHKITKKQTKKCCYLRNMCSSSLSIEFCYSYSCLKIA